MITYFRRLGVYIENNIQYDHQIKLLLLNTKKKGIFKFLVAISIWQREYVS